MPLSRLRLRIAAGFALAFGVSLALLAVAAFVYLRAESTHRLDARLAATARGVEAAMERERRDTPDSTLTFAATEVVTEWPHNGDGFVIVDSAGHVLAGVGTPRRRESVLQGWPPVREQFTVGEGERSLRVHARRVPAANSPHRRDAYGLAAFASMRVIVDDAELLAGPVKSRCRPLNETSRTCRNRFLPGNTL